MVGYKILDLWGKVYEDGRKRFGRRIPMQDENYEEECSNFMHREWALLDRSQQEEIQMVFREIDEVLLSPFMAWFEDIKSKMGIPNLDSRGKKLTKSPGEIERFLRGLQKDLKEKGP